jgi:hypothetical protein
MGKRKKLKLSEQEHPNFRTYLDPERDKDIVEFMETIPKPFRSEGVKLALREYMSSGKYFLKNSATEDKAKAVMEDEVFG